MDRLRETLFRCPREARRGIQICSFMKLLEEGTHGNGQRRLSGGHRMVGCIGQGAGSPYPRRGIRGDQMGGSTDGAGEPGGGLLLPGQGLRCLRTRAAHPEDPQHPHPHQGCQPSLGNDQPPAGGGLFRQPQGLPEPDLGNRDPVAFRDAELGLIRLRAFGVFNIRILQPVLFINSLVGTQGVYTTEEIGDYLNGSSSHASTTLWATGSTRS
jgi:hypothetical protein